MNQSASPQNIKNGAVIYLRVSSEEQVDNFSLSTQEDICRKEAARRSYSVVEIFKEEGRSAKTISGRPVLVQLLEYCRKNRKKISAVVVYRLDRVSRQTTDYLAIRKKLADCDITVISASEPTGDRPTDKLVETMLASIAQLDNDVRAERARNGLRARFLSGLISGKAPLGYKLENGFAIKDQETWDRVKDAWDLMATGKKSLAEMATVMNEWGLRETIGKGTCYFLRPQTTNRIFRQKFYMGVITSRKYPDEVRGQHTPMISEKQFYKVQAILDGKNTRKSFSIKRERPNNDFPLRRIVKCSQCGVGLTASWSKGRNSKYGYYRCSTGSKCTSKSISVKTMDATLLSLLKVTTPKKETTDLFVYLMQKSYADRTKRLRTLRERANREVTNLKTLRKTLVEKNLSGIYSDEIFKEQNDILEEKLTSAYIAQDDSLVEKYNIEAVTGFMKTLLADLGETYKRSSISQNKVLLGSIFPTGLAWNYNGTLNHKISPLYRSIMDFDAGSIPLGGGGEIRTHETLSSPSFPNSCHGPLGDASKNFRYYILNLKEMLFVMISDLHCPVPTGLKSSAPLN